MRTDSPPRGYSVEIALALEPAADEEQLERRYETVRRALHAYEDAVDPPLAVVLTRRGPQALDETALRQALEICRDAMVDVLGVPADDPAVTWSYDQAPGEHALLVDVRPRHSLRS